MSHVTAPDTAYAQWQRTRLAGVSGPAGNLALVDYHPVGVEFSAPDLVSLMVRRIGDEEGVRITPMEGAAMTLDGAPVDGETFMGRLQADGTPLLRWEGLTVDAFSLDGSDYELRIYDAAAENLANFAGIDCYAYDDDLRVTGVLRRHADIEHVPWGFTRTSDTGHTTRVPGLLEVEVLGERRELVAFLDSGNLVLVFADGTTGEESYAPGRFLRMDPPAEDGDVDVDFNYAFVPPCGFSDFYSCPIPPVQNRFAVPIRGGERRVRWHRPRY